MKKLTLENRMLYYESTGKRKLMKNLPVLVRLDGNNFSKFTKGLKRPYDERLSKVMIDLTKYLVELSGAIVGYTQSDEITLLLYTDRFESEIFFGGKEYKLNSILAGKASVRFNTLISKYIPEKSHLEPTFDCRTWNVPTKEEAANVFLWREKSGITNSVSMAARTYFSHKQVLNKNSEEMKYMLKNEKSIIWDDYDEYFRRGTYLRTVKELKSLTKEELEKIPLKVRDKVNKEFMRNVCKEVKDLPYLSDIDNKVNVLFFNEVPNLKK